MLQMFLVFLDYFNILISKINFKNKNKNIISIHFQVKNTLKNKCYHNTKHALSIKNLK